MLRAALFDIDGTLFDTERLWAEALALVFEELGCRRRPEELSRAIYGQAWPDAVVTLRRLYPEAMEGLSGIALGNRLCVRFDELFAFAPPIIPGAVDLLRTFHHHGIPCAYVSGSPRSTIQRNLAITHLTDYFRLEACVPSDDVTRGKPFPEGYQLALQRLHIAPEEALVLEDSRVGATAALAAGITRTYVCPPPGAPQQDYPADARRVSAWLDVLKAEGLTLWEGQ